MPSKRPEVSSQPYNETEFYVGLLLAISSSFFIGSSFIIKKKALVRINRPGSLRAGSGGFGYLKEWMWWTGFIFTLRGSVLIGAVCAVGVGEAANFAAYAFAPASLVTPLGALSVLVATVLSSKYLNENLNLLGKIGCVLCILGSTMIIIHSPKEEEVETLAELLDKLLDPDFVFYVVFVIALAIILVFYYGPRYGNRNVAVYLLLCSVIGSLTVMSCKGLGLALKETISGKSNDLFSWLTYAFLATATACIVLQMNYLNKALDLFNTSIVTPVYYVFFTTFVLVASAILFKEFRHLKADDIIGNLCGFLVIIIGITLLNAFKDVDVDLQNIRSSFRPKRELLLDSDSNGRYQYYGSDSALTRTM